MSRNRQLQSLYECVNPEYLRAWGGGVTVKDAIDYSIECIVAKAIRRRNTGYEVRMWLPNYTGKRRLMEHIFTKLSERLQKTSIRLDIGDEPHGPKDIMIDFVAFTTPRPKYSIPTSWNDDLKDFTWSDVIAHGHLYSSSSSDVWPPVDFKMRAQREKMQKILDARRSNPNIGGSDLY